MLPYYNQRNIEQLEGMSFPGIILGSSLLAFVYRPVGVKPRVRMPICTVNFYGYSTLEHDINASAILSCSWVPDKVLLCIQNAHSGKLLSNHLLGFRDDFELTIRHGLTLQRCMTVSGFLRTKLPLVSFAYFLAGLFSMGFALHWVVLKYMVVWLPRCDAVSVQEIQDGSFGDPKFLTYGHSTFMFVHIQLYNLLGGWHTSRHVIGAAFVRAEFATVLCEVKWDSEWLSALQTGQLHTVVYFLHGESSPYRCTSLEISGVGSTANLDQYLRIIPHIIPSRTAPEASLCTIIISRWEKHTGQTATLLERVEEAVHDQ